MRQVSTASSQLSFFERLGLELLAIILGIAWLETSVAPYFGFVKPAPGSGVLPLALLGYSIFRYTFRQLKGTQ